MTKKLINRTFNLLCLCLFVLKGIPLYYKSWLGLRDEIYYSKISQSRYDKFPSIWEINDVSQNIHWHNPPIFIIGTVLIAYIIIKSVYFIIKEYNNGRINSFFVKYTDPKLQQFCNWVNRRNKTEC